MSPLLRLVTLLTLAGAAGACRERARASTVDASAAPRSADAPAIARDAKLGADIDAFVAGFGAAWGEAHAARGVVAVARDGALVFSKAYGMPAGLDTRFAIGSVTKSLTAAAILRLVDAHRLALSEPARRLLPELTAPGSERVTIEHLLTHTSGVPSYTDDAELMRARDTPRTTASVLARIVSRPLAFTPGERFTYSNSNYYLLGLILERVTGEPYDAALRRLVLAPAGMTRTALEGSGAAARGEGDADDARGSTVNDDDRLVPIPPANAGLSFAASGLRSTARDLLAFDRALAGTLLSEGARVQMETPRKGAYACGWECWREAGEAVISHEGGVDGFSAFFGRAPDAKIAVVVLLAVDAFSGDRLVAGAIGEPVLSMALGGHAAAPPVETPIAPLDEARARAVTGEWTLARVIPGPPEPARARDVPSPPRLAIALDDARLFMSPAGEPKVRLFTSASGAWFPKQLGVTLEHDAGADALTLTRFGRKMLYRRDRK